MLGNSFGYSLNRKGYKLLNHNIGLIQGDGMTETSIPETYREYIKTGWSPENFITGSGGGLLVEGLTRDTDRWAIKVSYVERHGKYSEMLGNSFGYRLNRKGYKLLNHNIGLIS